MQQFDLEPGDYRERKPQGWRWKLPLDHEDDAKVPLVMFLGGIGMLAYLLTNLPEGTSFWITAAVGGIAFCTGGLFILWTRR